MKNQDIDQLFTMWEQHDARVDQIACAATPASQRKKAHIAWWRYGAAAAVVALVVTTLLLWPLAQEPTSSDNLLAANWEEAPIAATDTPCDTLKATPTPSPKTAPLPKPQVEEPTIMAQSDLPASNPTESTPELELLGIPTDETFQPAFVEDGHHQTYVRCNSLCDAHDIINKTQEAL